MRSKILSSPSTTEGYASVGQRDAILHDIWLLARGREPRLPLSVRRLPAEHDPLAAVLVVGLEHEPIAMLAR